MEIREAENLLVHNAAATDVVMDLTNRNDRTLSGLGRLFVPQSWRMEKASDTRFEMTGRGGKATLSFSPRLRENVVPDTGRVPVVLRLFCGEDGIVTKRFSLKAQKVQEWLVLGPIGAEFRGDIFALSPEEAFEKEEPVVRSEGRELKWRRVHTAGAVDLARLLGPLPENEECQAVLCSYVSFCGSHDRKLKEPFTLHLGSPNRARVEVNRTTVFASGSTDKVAEPNVLGVQETGTKSGRRGVVGIMLNEGWNFIVVRSYKGELDEQWSLEVDLTTRNEKYQGNIWYRYRTEERKD